MEDPYGIELTRVMLMGLAKECPYHRDNPKECSLREIRLMPLSARIEWVARLSDKECMDNYQRHLHCLDLQ
jgi:hypothetical protein